TLFPYTTLFRSRESVPRVKNSYASRVSPVKSRCRSSAVRSFVKLSNSALAREVRKVRSTVPALWPSGPSCGDDSELPPNLAEHVERELELLARMNSRHDRADARFVAGHSRIRNTLREHALFEQTVRQLHRQRAVADDNRRDRALAEAGIESERRKPRL